MKRPGSIKRNKLGWETLGSDPHGEHGLAWLLCDAAGWPEVSS